MLNQYVLRSSRAERWAFSSRQDGVVLMVALIILVAMTLGGLALTRSVDTTNLISGNLAFQQSATRSGEAGTEDAIRNFIAASSLVALQNDDFTRAYAASAPPSVATGNTANWWDAYWLATINPNPVARPVLARTCVERACTLPTDAAGNTASYTIERLCVTPGDPAHSATGCAATSQDEATSQPSSPGSFTYNPVTQRLYRVTTRIAGPRNTVSYIQTIVAR